jgi:hypothetical protein
VRPFIFEIQGASFFFKKLGVTLAIEIQGVPFFLMQGAQLVFEIQGVPYLKYSV